MLRGVRGRLPAMLCAGLMATAVAGGCGGGDDESTAKEEPTQVSAAAESAESFIMRMTRLVATTTRKKDCTLLEGINARSATRFTCPAPKELRDSMERFEVVGVEEYGTGAIVDYKSGSVKDGAAIVLTVAPDRNWATGRFGILTKPSTETSDEESREGYAEALDEFLTAVRERDCDAYVDITFNGDDKKDVVCKESFPLTKRMTRLMKKNPDAKPRYEGGNESYGFYSLEFAKPQPASFTISIAKADAKGPRPYVVLDATPGPTMAQRERARKAFLKEQKNKRAPGDMAPSSKPSDPAVTTP